MNRFQKYTLLLIGAITVLKIIASFGFELGNDEVYYWLYARYPALSHFDHPPMVGFFIQFFTGNLFFDTTVFIRFAAIFPAALNMWTLYRIARYIKDERSGFIAVLLYNISIYGFVISGLFILPDAPLLCFWLLAFYYFLKALPNNPENLNARKYFLCGMFFTALSIYSKYQAVYLLLGVFLYVVFYNRKWLKKTVTYYGFLLPLLSISLIFYWNFQNDFISYRFHNKRVSLFSFDIHFDTFFTELAGQLIYHHPYLFVLTFWIIIQIFRKKWRLTQNITPFFLVFILPLIATVFYLSLYKSTLPHWTGVAYITFLPFIAVYFSVLKKVFPMLYILLVLNILLLFFTVGVINNGWFLPEKTTAENPTQVGELDVTMDLYGWKKAGVQVKNFLDKNPPLKNLPMVSHRWFPAAHIDYYIARPMGKRLRALGALEDIHKYHWINQKLSPLKKQAIYITDSHNYYAPDHFKKYEFIKNRLLKIFPIERGGRVVKNIFVYLLSKNTFDMQFDNKKIQSYLAKGAVVLDVRNLDEYEEGHINGSTNIPLPTVPMELDAIKAFKKPVIAVCRSGNRSAQATDFLKTQGIDIINGGAWENVNQYVDK